MPLPVKSPFDSTIALLRDPYRFIDTQCRALNHDVFDTRILLRPTTCMRGREAAALFYDRERFSRVGAAPAAVQKTLFGVGGVQGLDGETHHHRKAMFLSIVDPPRVAALAHDFSSQLRSRAGHWVGQDQVMLYDQLCAVLTRTVCDWAGVALPDSDLPQRSRQLRALFDHAGARGVKHVGSRIARKRTEYWLQGYIQQLRAGSTPVAANQAAAVIAWHRDEQGHLLSPQVAAVELLNVLRPVVAVAVFVTFAVLALHDYADIRERLRQGDADYRRWFVQEVRRFYPFFPFVAARVRRAFEWHGHRFVPGRRVLLDLYGTNHETATWGDPQRFRPERFRQRADDPFDFIPQGGGDAQTGHRCPGEGIAMAVMEAALTFFTAELTYRIPAQDLRINFRRLPALPRSGLVLDRIRLQ